MSIIALILATLQPHIPGASVVERVVNEPLVKAAAYSLRFQSGLSVVSNEGSAVFVNEGKFGHFVANNPTFAKFEDMFYYVVGGEPTSFTTSQYSYVYKTIRARPLEWGSRDVAAAKDKNQVFVGTETGRSLRLSVVNLYKRGRRPNADIDIQPKFSTAPTLMAVNLDGGQPRWFVCHSSWTASSPHSPSVVEEVRFANGAARTKRLGVCGPGNYSDFDRTTKTLIAQGTGYLFLTRIGSYSALKISLPDKVEGFTRNAFLWQGKVFAQTDRLYVRDSDRKWKPFGSEFRLLAKSANGKYWLILDPYEKAWKVTF
jgi:hypothetical protein